MAEQPQEKPEVNGIQEQDFLAWRRSPVTKVFLQYLRDYREDLHKGVLELWQASQLQSAHADELKGRSNALAEIGDLPFQAIWTFYQQINAANQRDGETNAQESREQL